MVLRTGALVVLCVVLLAIGSLFSSYSNEASDQTPEDTQNTKGLGTSSELKSLLDGYIFTSINPEREVGNHPTRDIQVTLSGPSDGIASLRFLFPTEEDEWVAVSLAAYLIEPATHDVGWDWLVNGLRYEDEVSHNVGKVRVTGKALLDTRKLLLTFRPHNRD